MAALMEQILHLQGKRPDWEGINTENKLRGMNHYERSSDAFGNDRNW
jgi:hypothetical protein